MVIDDHNRYLYVEQRDRDDADTNAGTVTRAIEHFWELGLRGPEAVMTSNAMICTRSHRFRELRLQLGAKHITQPPLTPRWNGKAGRVIQTLQDEWAYPGSTDGLGSGGRDR